MLLDYAKGSSGVVLDVLLDLFNSLSVFLLSRNVPLLLVGHAVLKAQSLDALHLEALPSLAILGLPVLSGYGTL